MGDIGSSGTFYLRVEVATSGGDLPLVESVAGEIRMHVPILSYLGEATKSDIDLLIITAVGGYVEDGVEIEEVIYRNSIGAPFDIKQALLSLNTAHYYDDNERAREIEREIEEAFRAKGV